MNLHPGDRRQTPEADYEWTAQPGHSATQICDETGSFFRANQQQAEITSGIGSIGRFVTLNLRNGPYETLKGRGLDLISNQSLRVKITSLYEDEIPNLVEDSVIDRQLARDRILPSILEWFWLDAAEDWILKEVLPVGWRNDLVTLGRYRARTLDGYYLPSFERTMRLMRDVLAEIEAELNRSQTEEKP